MYLYLGQNTVINTKNIIGIFDLDNATVKKSTRNFLFSAEKEKKTVTVIGEDLPKSFIVAEKGNEKIIYISQISTKTILKRLGL